MFKNPASQSRSESPLWKLIRAGKPDIKDTSVTAYESTLSNLYQIVFPEDGSIDLEKFNDTETFMAAIEKTPSKSRMNKTAALLTITRNKEDAAVYRKQMKEDQLATQTELAKQEMTPDQALNSVPREKVNEIFRGFQKNANWLYKKGPLNARDRAEIQDYVILAVTTGIYIPPRRTLDWTAFKLKNIDLQRDNYMDGDRFVFNQYKTAGTYHLQTTDKIPPVLKKLIVKWKTVNHSDFLLVNRKGEPLDSTAVYHRLVKIFQKKISTRALRRMFVSWKFEPLIKLNDQLAHTMEQMGSSTRVMKNYLKRPATASPHSSEDESAGGVN